MFKKKHIKKSIIRLFDKSEYYQGDLLKDFIYSIGMKWDGDFKYPKVNGLIDNPRLTFVLYRKHFIFNNDNLKFMPPKDVYESYLNYFEESNEWVRKEFFPHKERLFPKKDVSNYKENYGLKEMKPEYWDKIAEFIADIIKDKNKPSNTIFKTLRFCFHHLKEMFKLIRSYIARNKN
ncbi:hypothetical protein B4R09_06985 [Campylobacter lari]|nr:hypothetical protein [Campylobacter lari]EAK5847415.1 hypothetical protein [Campylobacter lari]